MKKCFYCGWKNEDPGKSCTRCGTDFADENIRWLDLRTTFRDKKTGQFSRGGLSVILLFLMLLFFPLFYSFEGRVLRSGDFWSNRSISFLAVFAFLFYWAIPTLLALGSFRKEGMLSRLFALATMLITCGLVFLSFPLLTSMWLRAYLNRL